MTNLPDPVLDAVIDVSHWNGTIDWTVVAGAGIALSFIKATEGEGNIDPMFAANMAGAAAAGIMTVPYHFIDDGAGAATQAQHFLSTAGLKTGQPAMLDWETSASLAVMRSIGFAVQGATSRDPVGYYGYSKIAAPDAELSGWPLMLPEYPRGGKAGDYASLVTAPPRVPPGRDRTRPYDFHQYTRAGHVPGISGPVDRSVWCGTRDELAAWFKTGVRPATF